MSDALNDLKVAFERAGQGHVFAYFDQLSADQQRSLAEQAAQIDLDELADLNTSLVKNAGQAKDDFEGLSPAPYVALPENGGDKAQWTAMAQKGEAALQAGRVAAFVVAGGQGTRLGYDGPKGTFPASAVRQATLFQLFAEKLLFAQRRYGKPIHWFIMTSILNHEATVSFFEEHQYFGLEAANVHCFRQGLMPAVDQQGKILLEGRGTIAMSPDGHGGSLRALVKSGAVDKMKSLGIDILSYFQVDNPLVKPLDPAFIGFHLESGSEMSSKMLPKAYAQEKVGNFCQRDGKVCVIEYSDLPEALASQTDAAGKLSFIAGSIAIHMIDREFIQRVGDPKSSLRLPFHRANKKIAVYQPETGKSVKPNAPNGIKFEMFVFDALPFARNAIIIETARQDDFSPIKNAEGVDSPATSRDDQLREHARWLAAVGDPVATDDTGLPGVCFEIAPTFADSETTFVEAWSKLDPKPVVTEGTVID
jgi:UDP-N-acetylglucosamine/UDP-N-acetylgalactosamine diphosphorylase